MNFARNQTALPTAISTTGLDFASFLLGYVDSAGLSIYGPYEPRQRTWQFGFYAQDDFKITQKLTVNYGLRLDILTPLIEANDYYSMVDTTKPNPVAGNLPGTHVFAGHDGVGSRIALADKNSNNLGPRLASAYRSEDGPSRRLRHQLFPDRRVWRWQQRESERCALADVDDLVTRRPERSVHVCAGFPTRDLVIPPLITPALGVGSGFVNYWHPTAGVPGMQNWSVGEQRAIGRSMSIDVAHVRVVWRSPAGEWTSINSIRSTSVLGRR